LFLGPLFSVLSFLWDSLWLVEELLTLLWLLLIMRIENFLIGMRDIYFFVIAVKLAGF
jgi:hypothetical protein